MKSPYIFAKETNTIKMQTIDLKNLIETRDLDKKELASFLFPEVIHPTLALKRVIKGESVLNANQISRLAHFTEMDINSLFSGSGWGIVGNSDNTLTLTNKEYKAILDLGSWVTKVYHKKTLLHETIILPKGVTLSEYISKLEELIR